MVCFYVGVGALVGGCCGGKSGMVWFKVYSQGFIICGEKVQEEMLGESTDDQNGEWRLQAKVPGNRRWNIPKDPVSGS